MFKIFSTREIATALWLFILIIFFIRKKEIRSAGMKVIKAALNIHILIPFIILSIYAFCISFVFYKLGIDIINYLKDIILWFLFAGVPFAYSSISNKNIDFNYFKNYIIENIKIITILQFIINTFTFSIWIELIIIPLITFIVLLEAVCPSDDKYKVVKKFLSTIISSIGIFILISSLGNAISTYNNFGTINLLITFFIPFVFSILYVPIVYCFILYARYEVLFCRIEFAIKIENKKRYKKLFMKKFKFSLKKINYYLKNCVYKLYKNISDEDFLKLILETELNYKQSKT